MVRVELRGIAKTKAKGRTYYYAWRGGLDLSVSLGARSFIGPTPKPSRAAAHPNQDASSRW
jgi:hypothetical protein